MDLARVQRGEWVAMAGGALLVVSVFLTWYHLKHNGSAVGHMGPASLTGWQSHSVIRWLLLAAAVAPFILTWIVLNDYALSWPRGEMTSIVAIAAFGVVGYVGVIDRPGSSNSLIPLRFGWVLAIIATLLMLGGSLARQQETGRRRKPPGTL